MKTSILSVLVSISTIALAQSLDGLPSCAQTAALNGAAGSGCGLSDAECLCKNSGFIESLRVAISTTCSSAADQQAACAWGNNACSAFGVSIPCSSSASSAPADSNNPVSTSSMVDPQNTPASDAGSSPSMVSSVAAGSTPSSMMSDSGSMTGSMTTSMVPSNVSASSSMTSMTSMMNGTHTNGTATHSSTKKPSATSAGPTSQYTGAGNAAVRHSGVVGTVVGVALLFAFF